MSLIQLAEAVEAAMDELGFPRESRPYSPHLTLARMKEGGRAIGRVIEQQGLLTKESGTIGCLTVRTLTLMKSELRPSGAVYTRLAEIALKDER
jgi:2'-5' RNA ligase